MNIALARSFLLWCTVINYGILLRWDLVVQDGAPASAVAESLAGQGIKPLQQPTGIAATDAWGLTVRVLAG